METGKEDEYLSSSDSGGEDESQNHSDAMRKRRVQNENFKALLVLCILFAS